MRQLLRDRRLANRGDARADARFRSTVEQWTARANRMLDILEKHGYTKQAYESALRFIRPAFGEDATRFSTDLTNSRAMYKQALAINHFLTLESSTLKGSRAIERRRVKAFREKFKDSKYSGAVKKMKKQDILDFFDFLHDHPTGQFLSESSRFQSGDEMDNFMEAMYIVGRSTDEIDKALAAFTRTDTWNATHPNEIQPVEERFYFDDLLKFLKGGIDIIWNEEDEHKFTIKKGKFLKKKYGKKTKHR